MCVCGGMQRPCVCVVVCRGCLYVVGAGRGRVCLCVVSVQRLCVYVVDVCRGCVYVSVCACAEAMCVVGMSEAECVWWVGAEALCVCVFLCVQRPCVWLVCVERLCLCGGYVQRPCVCAEAVCVCRVCAEVICVWRVCQRLCVCVWCVCNNHGDPVFWTDGAMTSWALRQARSSFLTNTLGLYSSTSSLLCLQIGAQTPAHILKR